MIDVLVVSIILLGLTLFLLGFYVGVRFGTSRTETRYQDQVTRLRQIIDRAGLALPGQPPRRLKSDEATHSWTGQPITEQATQPPGAPLSWADAPSPDRKA